MLTGDTASFLRNQPCDLLPIAFNIKERLHDFGLHKLGQISAMPLSQLQAQFGPEGKRIWELAAGHDDTPLYPRLTDERIEGKRHFTVGHCPG